MVLRIELARAEYVWRYRTHETCMPKSHMLEEGKNWCMVSRWAMGFGLVVTPVSWLLIPSLPSHTQSGGTLLHSTPHHQSVYHRPSRNLETNPCCWTLNDVWGSGRFGVELSRAGAIIE